jgi:hypothetical protein
MTNRVGQHPVSAQLHPDPVAGYLTTFGRQAAVIRHPNKVLDSLKQDHAAAAISSAFARVQVGCR